ncbi:MAG: molecular chaperone TorD family protein [Hydrogenophaga sp.]|jgi:TorA maturation chaperone TorD|uniref:TorD/DmsD family molecular chaperone n=1 Tax=Hydrogenophaga sp. TaxID=1904254 RepID=UPI002719FE67|nr:molecular chaperone TorD family protein [Hydrogenophaga sp.]MDO9250958.1 molecular chaperone TorD family protein [Hydrogenophaga sp.]MDP2404935.1 molecular chaperone TorD family protein [Hydrogenophaga sp.]MDP3322004.1 molecular chaperone TorD family protein [Hydrogenophaga sp.]MDZ4173373.1 molecular chaperone TorD family protein [Hydrogenophaga sp.]
MNDSISVSSALDEETARAEVYGLLAALYYAAPSPALMAQLRVAVTEAPAAGGFLEEPWREVVAAARAIDDVAVSAEFDALFGGVGRAEVFLFGSHYLSGFLNEKPLAALRSDLAALGLGRDDTMSETEDHFAYLCEVMRYLIAGEEVEVANLTQQQKFFTTHVQPWAPAMCDAIAAHPKARFYAALAGFTRAFIGVEMQGFDMLA